MALNKLAMCPLCATSYMKHFFVSKEDQVYCGKCTKSKKKTKG